MARSHATWVVIARRAFALGPVSMAIACMRQLDTPPASTSGSVPAARATVGGPAPATERFPPRLHVRYTETDTRAGQSETRTVEERLRWLRNEGARRIYEAVDDDGVSHEFFGDAIGNLDSVDSQTGKLAQFDPPQVVIPASPAVGMRWGASHKLGNRVVSTSRHCELVAGERCAAGLTSHCTSHLTSGKVVEMRQHYCDGVGYVGEDDVVTGPDGKEALRVRIDSVTDIAAP